MTSDPSDARFPPRLTAGVRRVTTAIDACGRAVVARDEIVAGDERALLLWGADAPPVRGEGVMPGQSGWWPPPGGVRVALSSRAPDQPSAGDAGRDLPDIDGVAGFHDSATADIVIVLAGTIWLELDDRVEVTLRAGDVLVQNGTRHRWRNHGSEWPIVAVVIVGTAAQDGSEETNA